MANPMETFLAHAQATTTLEAVELLLVLRQECSPVRHQKIDELVQRLTTMARVFTEKPGGPL